MATPFISFEQFAAAYSVEHDRLFERLLGKLKAHKSILLAAKQGWGLQDYVKELGFQLEEGNPEAHICHMDMRPVYTSTSFLEFFAASLSQRFPEETSQMEMHSQSINVLQWPALIARRNKVCITVFLANAHLLHRFKNQDSFLRILRLNFKNQKNCSFCLYGYNTQQFRDLANYPGPVSGLGQWTELMHNQEDHRSASVRKLFHDHQKRIGIITSFHLSHMVDNHPFYLKLLAWHALLRTSHTCSIKIIENAMTDLIHHFNHLFFKIAEGLTQSQLSLLKALAEGNQKLFSKATRDKYQLGTSGHIAGTKLSLEKKEIIESRNDEIKFTDPIFREWLRRFCFEYKIPTFSRPLNSSTTEFEVET